MAQNKIKNADIGEAISTANGGLGDSDPQVGLGAVVNAATAKATPVNADSMPVVDSADSNKNKKVTWSNIKATLKTYFDTVYQAAGTYLTAANISDAAYGSGWNGDTTIAPSKNAVYDKIETLGGGAADVQTFTTLGAGTWTKPASGKMVRVQVWGAGGSGGMGGGTGSGGGGGGGAYVEKLFNISDLGSTEAVFVATGGAAPGSPAAGNVGGNSTFGTSATRVTAYGGGGGTQGSTGGSGGGASSAGGNGVGGSPVGGAAATSTVVGGESVFGGGGSGSGGSGATPRAGGASYYGGGGGGGGAEGNGGAAGGASTYGGAGGGGGASDSSPGGGAAGVSVYGGNGGAGAFDANNAGNGVTPGGGGGGSESGTSGAGGNGKVVVTTF